VLTGAFVDGVGIFKPCRGSGSIGYVSRASACLAGFSYPLFHSGDSEGLTTRDGRSYQFAVVDLPRFLIGHSNFGDPKTRQWKLNRVNKERDSTSQNRT